MAIFDRFDLKVIAVGGLCGVAIALSPGIAAAGGYECLQTSAGEAGPAAAAPVCAPVAEMAGVPMALPGPPIVPPLVPPPIIPPPLVPPVVPPPLVPPLVPPVPIVPIGAPIAAGAPLAPLTTMGGAAGGKGDSTGPAPAGAPVAGQPTAPGPTGH
ncbi:hypothetical protein [Mycobacterium neglectum]|jgi:hypothetical protein|uniref:hypothetical protein n=1 Tax=Mycobacterium neglectum TaxID=242737 RepID=UPI000BFF1848|nr:hypothetical protein [Mycobacterium neglectum]